MKTSAIGILLCIFSLHLQAAEGTEGHGGDEMRLLFEEGRVDAFQKIPQIKRCSLPATTNPQVVEWILRNKNLLATDIFKSRHVWITDRQSTCAFTQTKPEFDVTLSFQACGNVKTKEGAGRLLSHESVHHLGIADESLADAIAFAIYAADLKKTCHPPANDPFDPLSCSGQPITLDQVRHVLKPGISRIKIGEFKVHSRFRWCQTLGGCTNWVVGNNDTYKQIGLGWSDGTSAEEKQLTGQIDVINYNTFLRFGLTADGDSGRHSNSANTLESNGLSKDGFFDGYNPRGPTTSPKFNGRLRINGPWSRRIRSLTSLNSWNYSAGVFTETNLTNSCLRSKWSYSTTSANSDSYSETEVVASGNLNL